MARQLIRTRWTGNKLLALTAVCALGSCAIAFLTVTYGTTRDFELLGLATASRTLNQLTAIVLTCMALIVPLTSNLYTPKLVKLYVTHPLIVIGLSVLVLSHLTVMATSFFPKDHPLSKYLIHAIALAYLVVLTATLPYLYGMSQFLRPSYFIPMLTRKGVQNLRRLTYRPSATAQAKQLFETIDVVTNIALTGMHRGDRQLVLLALEALHTLLSEILVCTPGGGAGWRETQPLFVPGLAREGREYLSRRGGWPEAYVLAQMLKVMEEATQRQHEILAEMAGQLVHTAQLAHAQRRGAIVELHVMAFNTLMRDAIEAKDLRRFQNLSYHYRLMIEAFQDDPALMHAAAQHLVHYGGLASRLGLDFGLETVVYDLGEVILSIARYSEEDALHMVEGAPGSFLLESLGQGLLQAKVGWRTLVHLYWEARAGGLHRLADLLNEAFLQDDAIHREQIQRALGENRELHFEFNDRLMRFAHLSAEAEVLARRFVEGR